MIRTDCPSPETLSAFALGRLLESEQCEIAEHLDAHTECEERISRLDGAADAFVDGLRHIGDSGQGMVIVATEPAGSGEAALPAAIEDWGEFRIVREIGRGGMGVVYEAEQVSLGRRVALTVLPRQLGVHARTRQRFEREARSAARLHHTNIVPVFGVGEHHGQPYYVMQFIRGSGLDEILDELRRLRAAGKAGGGSPTDRRTATREDGDARPAIATGGRTAVVRDRDVPPVEVARSLWTGRFVPTDDDEAPLAMALRPGEHGGRSAVTARGEAADRRQVVDRRPRRVVELMAGS